MNNELHQTTEAMEKSLLAERFRGYLPVIIDVETAGFNSQTDALLEIGLTTVDMNDSGRLSVKESYSFDIEPFEGANLEQSALEFTGIDTGDPKRIAMSEQSALKELFAIVRSEIKKYHCKRAIIVAHNANFDYQFLTAAINRTQVKRNPFHPFSTMDTATLGGFVYGHTVLATVCKIAGIDIDNDKAHSAAYDSQITAQLFCEMVNLWLDLGGWEKAMKLQQKNQSPAENSE